MNDGTILNDVAQLIEVPDNGTLSRVVYKDDFIRVVGFGFDTGQELTDHTAGVPVTIQVVSGTLDITMAGRTEEIGPGSWVQIPAGLSHAVRAQEPSVMLLTLLRGS